MSNGQCYWKHNQETELLNTEEFRLSQILGRVGSPLPRASRSFSRTFEHLRASSPIFEQLRASSPIFAHLLPSSPIIAHLRPSSRMFGHLELPTFHNWTCRQVCEMLFVVAKWQLPPQNWFFGFTFLEFNSLRDQPGDSFYVRWVLRSLFCYIVEYLNYSTTFGQQWIRIGYLTK